MITQIVHQYSLVSNREANLVKHRWHDLTTRKIITTQWSNNIWSESLHKHSPDKAHIHLHNLVLVILVANQYDIIPEVTTMFKCSGNFLREVPILITRVVEQLFPITCSCMILKGDSHSLIFQLKRHKVPHFQFKSTP